MSNTKSGGPKTVSQARAAARNNPLVASILDAEDIPHQDEEVPEWGGVTLRIRGMDGATRNWYEQQLWAIRGKAESDEVSIDPKGSRHAQLLSRCLYDPDTGERLPITADQLAAKSGSVLSRLAEIALGLSGMGRRAVEDAEGNSGAAQSGSSTSG